ncbi:TPA: hypothetical protein ACOIT9_002841 [Enterococcus faecalis]|uniref:hypothetical protein n=1 Tax=Enterococcus faecalis TaxID=1351 RepID=UPI000AE0A697|nr:hypothetical protein [Enterococcus faecalis]HAQ1417387.1 hypothetical protein [Enterococcus faecium Ef_aus0018]HAQ2074010.1 hypothetical protein [Enterococcus faecium]EIW2162959.1 hypothetical protein [Enterococcus faecalis]MBT2155056.1 hypothetical protein [Enterococcus faecalis]MDU2475982.1 hypothetical protein [Enterococcus faecalis]
MKISKERLKDWRRTILLFVVFIFVTDVVFFQDFNGFLKSSLFFAISYPLIDILYTWIKEKLNNK